MSATTDAATSTGTVCTAEISTGSTGQTSIKPPHSGRIEKKRNQTAKRGQKVPPHQCLVHSLVILTDGEQSPTLPLCDAHKHAQNSKKEGGASSRTTNEKPDLIVTRYRTKLPLGEAWSRQIRPGPEVRGGDAHVRALHNKDKVH